MNKNKKKEISKVNSRLSILCRLCLSINNESMIDVFTVSSKMNRKISHLVTECVSVHITEQDELPKCICQLCYTQLEEVHQFQMRAIESDRRLRRYVLQWHATGGEIEIPGPECSSDQGSSDKVKLLDSEVGLQVKKETFEKNGETSDDTDQLDIKIEPENHSTATNLFIDDKSIFCETTLIKFNNLDQLNIKKEPVKQDNKNLKTDDGTELIEGSYNTFEDTEKNVKSLESISNSSNYINEKVKLKRYRYDKNKSLKRLKLCHIDDKSYQCDVCSEYFTELNMLKSHQQIHIGKKCHRKPYQCDVCNKHFTTPCYLKQHKLIHTGVKSYLCDICSKSFRLLHHLNRHKLLHTGVKPYHCDVCIKSFADLANLKTHKLLHTGERPHQCEVCSKCFSKLSHLKRHAILHTGEKPFQCGICSKYFSQASHLKRHKLIHTGEKPFQCNVCHKSFSYLSGLKTHKILHMGDKRHRCDVCDKQFFRIDQLKSHKRLHTGEKPHQCDVCNRGFAHLNGLKYHKRQHL